MKIDDLVLKNSGALATVGPNKNISQATTLLSGLNIGALPVCDSSGNLIGIISIFPIASVSALITTIFVADVAFKPGVDVGGRKSEIRRFSWPT